MFRDSDIGIGKGVLFETDQGTIRVVSDLLLFAHDKQQAK